MIFKKNNTSESNTQNYTIFKKKRFPDGKSDSFMRAWMMICASGASGISIFNKKHLTKELRQYMQDLCLTGYDLLPPEEKAQLSSEWEDFAITLFSTCVESKTYCSTLFGLIPVKDASVARKLAEEIDFVTRIYPAALSCEDDFLPFRSVMIQCYCSRIENGSAYWNEISRH